MQQINGKCHCGNIGYTFARPETMLDVPARACGCSFCVKHGGLYTSHPEGRLDVQIVDESQINIYKFGTKTADFYICRTCGVVPFVTSTIDGNQYAVVSVNSFEEFDRSLLNRAAADFDGEGVDDRLARRKRSWIGLVTIR